MLNLWIKNANVLYVINAVAVSLHLCNNKFNEANIFIQYSSVI